MKPLSKWVSWNSEQWKPYINFRRKWNFALKSLFFFRCSKRVPIKIQWFIVSFVKRNRWKQYFYFGINMNFYPYFPFLLSDLSEILLRHLHIPLLNRVACKSEHRRSQFPCERKRNYICASTVKPDDVLKIMNGLLKSAYYVMKYTIWYPVFFSAKKGKNHTIQNSDRWLNTKQGL
jgi:hypothetical protein